jgi:ArsR family transcriptional regulator
VETLIKALGRVGERNVAEIGRVVTDYFQARDALEPVSRDDLVARLRADLVTLLDVRPEDEFELEVIAYCRGPYCVLSFEAVAALRAHGYRVRRLEDGYPEWKAAGLPVESVA